MGLMDYFTQEFAVPVAARRQPTLVRRVAAFLFGVTRITDPCSNQSGQRALALRQSKTLEAVSQGSADDWNVAGKGLSKAFDVE